MIKGTEQMEQLFAEGAKRLVARAADNYSLPIESVIGRIRTGVQKYLLNDEPETPATAINEFIDKLQADDLCMIIACEEGNQRAWNDLVERFSATVRSAARSAGTQEEGAEDLAQSIWAELHGLRRRDDGKPAGKLAYYSGRGSLAGWLRAVVAQLAIDQHRKQSRLVQTEEDADFDRIVSQNHDRDHWSTHSSEVNPEIEITRKLLGAAINSALSRAIGELAAENRLLVKLYYFDGLRLHEAGRVLGVHEATASRRLTRIHADLRREVENILVTENGWTKSEAARAFSDIAIHLEGEIEPLVARESMIVKNENEVTG
jgi:RNA polymerase sigma-70 factor